MTFFRGLNDFKLRKLAKLVGVIFAIARFFSIGYKF